MWVALPPLCHMLVFAEFTVCMSNLVLCFAGEGDCKVLQHRNNQHRNGRHLLCIHICVNVLPFPPPIPDAQVQEGLVSPRSLAYAVWRYACLVHGKRGNRVCLGSDAGSQGGSSLLCSLLLNWLPR